MQVHIYGYFRLLVKKDIGEANAAVGKKREQFFRGDAAD